MKIEAKTAFVSGRGSGIGQAAAFALVERGAKVVVADIIEDAGQQTVDLTTKKRNGLLWQPSPARNCVFSSVRLYLEIE